MKLISCLLFLFLIEMYDARRNSASSNIIRIPLKRVQQKIKKQNSAHGRAQRAAVDIDASYTYNLGTVSFGTPKQSLDVVFDTGSLPIWVLSKNYDFSDPNSKFVYEKHHTYNHDASSTYKRVKYPEPFLYFHDESWLFGFEATDKVKFVGDDVSATFTEVTRAEGFFPQSRIDGVVGLQYTFEDGNIITTICDTVKGLNRFSFFLPRFRNATAKGELILCGEDQSKYAQSQIMRYYPEIEPGKWRISLESVLAYDYAPRQYNISLAQNTAAQIDTGTPYIWAPKESVTIFKNIVKQYLKGNPDDLQIECKSNADLPFLSFTYKGDPFPYSIIGSHYILPMTTNPKMCQILLRENLNNNDWRIGEPFLRQYVALFDIENHQFGFILSKGY